MTTSMAPAAPMAIRPGFDVNVIDHPWIPTVTDTGPVTVSLREFFHRASHVTALSPTLAPVETEAMIRFLTSVAALILRESDDVTDPVVVDTFLDRYHDRFWLFDPDRPFMQEWHVTSDQRAGIDKGVLPLAQLHVHVPGGSSSTWCLRPEDRPVTPTLLPVLLIAKWFHGKPGNGAAPAFYQGKQASGAPSGGPVDSTFHLFGATMDETLRLNVPEPWLDTPDFPAWLDQDTTPAPAEITDGGAPLWRATWTANRPLVLHAGDGNLTGWVIGLTSRPVPNLGGQDVKENAKLARGRGYAHVHYDVTAKDGTVTTRRVIAPQRLDRTEGLLTWYSKSLDQPLRNFGHDRVLPPEGARVAFHDEEGDTYGNRKRSQWVLLDRTVLTVPDSLDRAALLNTASQLGEGFRSTLWSVVEDRANGRKVAHQAASSLYSRFDPLVLPALQRLGASETVDVAALVHALCRVATTHFDETTAPYLTPATTATVMAARAHYRRVVMKIRKPFTPTPAQEQP